MTRTPLYPRHVELNAQMTDFGGFDMPLRYSGDKAEHMAVREHVGLFDVSHMGELAVEGPKAEEAMNLLLTNDATAASHGQAYYAAMLNESGTIIDDVVAYKFSSQRFLICVNASNRKKDAEWVESVILAHFSDSEVAFRNESDDWAQIAVQGPKASALVAALCDDSTREIKRYHFASGTLTAAQRSIEVILARTGYTGEDGFEIFCRPGDVLIVWDALLERGAAYGVQPCGLAARDTLRLEAGMCLYGNDIDESTTPLEAGLGWVVKWDKKTPFIGQAALLAQKQSGIQRRLCGLEVVGPGIIRHGYAVLSEDDKPIGTVTSGTLTPNLGKAIAMAYLNRPYAEPGTRVRVDVRGRMVEAQVVKLPFYRRPV